MSRPQPTFITPGEMRVLKCIVETGGGNKVVANALLSTEGTVKVHLKSLLSKARCLNRQQLAFWAVCHGLVELPAFGIAPPAGAVTD